MFFASPSVKAKSIADLLPQPQKVQPIGGRFHFAPNAAAFANLQGEELDFLTSYLPTVLPIQEVTTNLNDSCALEINVAQPEVKLDQSAYDTALQSYTLTIVPDKIEITSPTPTGAFYALQTLRQLVEADSTAECAAITDQPRYTYRGVMMDVSRHFFTKDYVLRTLDAIALFKLNRFHLHLTDAGGWRMESARFPELTEKTAYRTQEDWEKWWINRDRRYCDKEAEDSYGGYFTAAELREIERYAADRQIVVVPEIEMPGHSEEVTFAYPQLSCNGVPGDAGELCVGNEETFEFLEGTLTELMEIFPSLYIHIGGDEASRHHWEACPKCQKRMAEEGFTKPYQLQNYLTERIERFLNSKGRRLLGWDEIMEGHLADNAAVMSWRGTEAGLKAARAGHHVVMSPGKYCYFDQCQDNPPSRQHPMQGNYLPLDSVYAFCPLPPEEDGGPIADFIDGLQGNVWTEWIATPDNFSAMLWPRAEAIAEVGWSHRKTSFSDFHRRTELFRPWLSELQIHQFEPSKAAKAE